MIICTAYKAGGAYDGADIEQLQWQVRVHADRLLWVFSDSEVAPATRRVKHSYPGWWCKMNLFDPTICDNDLFYMDLDTMIRGNIRPMIAELIKGKHPPMILNDVYRPLGKQSSVMYIPHRFKQQVWNMWSKKPNEWMHRFEVGGDQAFLELFPIWRELDYWFPSVFASYKAEVLPGTPRGEKAPVVFFHGKPKPRDIKWTLPAIKK